MATFLETINLEVQMQNRCEEHRGEKVIHTLFALCNDLNSIQCVLKETEYQLDLPAIGIQDNDLKRGDVGSICDKSIGCSSNRTFDPTKEDARRNRVRRLNNTVTYVCPMSLNAIGHGPGELLHGLDEKLIIGAHHHKCLGCN